MDYKQAHFNMVEQQIRPWDVLDPKVLEALKVVPRHEYVPLAFQELAYMDVEIPLGDQACIWPARIDARLIQGLNIQPQDSILEIGTGSGYVTALLAQLGARVDTVEIHEELSKAANDRFLRQGYKNITTWVGDGCKSLPAEAKYDVIYIAGALESLPQEAIVRLADGGRLGVIMGKGQLMQARILRRKGDTLMEESLFETCVSPLVRPKIAQFDF